MFCTAAYDAEPVSETSGVVKNEMGEMTGGDRSEAAHDMEFWLFEGRPWQYFSIA